MMKITRYWICGASSGYGCDAKAEPHPDGEYMLYSDHAAAEAEWQREREAWEKASGIIHSALWRAFDQMKCHCSRDVVDIVRACIDDTDATAASQKWEAAEQANGELREALARVRANASIPHRIKQIVDEALGAAS